MSLVDRVARLFCLCDAGGDRSHADILWEDDPSAYTGDAQAAISEVLKEMLAGRSINLAGGDYTERWRATIRCFAAREDIEIG